MATPKMKSQEPSNQENNTELKNKNSHPQTKYFCHTSKGSQTAWGNFWKNTTYKQYSSPPQKYNKCYGQQRTEGTPSPLQEYTGYLAVVDRYILEPQNAAFTLESNNMRDTAD